MPTQVPTNPAAATSEASKLQKASTVLKVYVPSALTRRKESPSTNSNEKGWPFTTVTGTPTEFRRKDTAPQATDATRLTVELWKL
jgi:hypothetical protein